MARSRTSYKPESWTSLIQIAVLGLLVIGTLVLSLIIKQQQQTRSHASTTYVYNQSKFSGYGWPSPQSPNPAVMTATEKSNWQTYLNDPAVQSDKLVGTDAGIIGWWAWREADFNTFMDNCNDSEYDPNTPCYSWDYNWQVGWGIHPYDSLVGGNGHHLQDAFAAMYPNSTVQQVGQAVINASATRDTQYGQITYPSSTFPNYTIDQIVNGALSPSPDAPTDSTNVQWRTWASILMKDDKIGAYLVAEEFADTGLNSNLASTVAGWGSYYDKQTVINYIKGVYDAGIVDNSSNATPTPVPPTATPTPTPAGQSQLLQNPGFESGNSNWSPTSTTNTTPIGTFSNYPPHSGSYYVWFDGDGTTHTDTISQTVSIPSNVSSANLSFWLRVDTAETTTTSKFDTLTVQLKNSSGSVLTTLATYSNLDKGSSYVQKSFDISSYKGQSVQVYFNGTEDNSLQTSFLLDDVALTTQGSTTTATATPTKAPTPTPTPTASVQNPTPTAKPNTADLSIPSFSLTDSSGNAKTSFTPGQTIYVKLTAKNGGSAGAASGAITNIYRNSSSAPAASTASDISGGFQITHGYFAANSSYIYCSTSSCSGGYANQFKNTSGTVVNTFTAPSSAGSYTAWAYINYNNSVSESSTSNNTASYNYSVVSNTPTPTSGSTATATPTTASSQLLKNPGFESGSNGNWTDPKTDITSGSVTVGQTNCAMGPHAGSYWAWAGGYSSGGSDNFYQQVTIPSGITSATLTYYLRVCTDETTTTTKYDTLSVQIRNSSGSILATPVTYSNLDHNTSYVQKTVDLSSYKGQTIQINFAASNDSSLQTSFGIDDTSLTTH